MFGRFAWHGVFEHIDFNLMSLLWTSSDENEACLVGVYCIS